MKFKTLMMLLLIFFTANGLTFASPTLSKNSSGRDVLTLQKKLYLIGYAITEFDGIFGAETEKAVSAFQKDQKISVTGIVNNATWRALKKVPPIAGRTLPPINDKTKQPTEKVDTTKPNNGVVPLGMTF